MQNRAYFYLLVEKAWHKQENDKQRVEKLSWSDLRDDWILLFIE